MSDEQEIGELLNGVTFKFGLVAQGHISTVEKMLANGKSWEEIGLAIGWHGPTAKEYYERFKKHIADGPELAGRD